MYRFNGHQHCDWHYLHGVFLLLLLLWKRARFLSTDLQARLNESRTLKSNCVSVSSIFFIANKNTYTRNRWCSRNPKWQLQFETHILKLPTCSFYYFFFLLLFFFYRLDCGTSRLHIYFSFRIHTSQMAIFTAFFVFVAVIIVVVVVGAFDDEQENRKKKQ